MPQKHEWFMWTEIYFVLGMIQGHKPSGLGGK